MMSEPDADDVLNARRYARSSIQEFFVLLLFESFCFLIVRSCGCVFTCGCAFLSRV